MRIIFSFVIIAVSAVGTYEKNVLHMLKLEAALKCKWSVNGGTDPRK